VSKALEAFGKYLLLERLAAGGMAEVYLAKSAGVHGIGKFVAIKRILPQYSDNEEFIGMFKEEAKLVMNLNHSNIVSIFDFGVERKQFFLVMEFVEGQNLRQVLNHMKKKDDAYFSIDQIVHMAKEVASGLDHAHRCIDASTGRQLNIIHRDMSPQNIMVSLEGEVKVVDFGIAKAETQLEQTRSGTIKGKFGYMSPEQAEGQQVDTRTDIFSLGIVLYELLIKDRLFTAPNEQAVLKKIKDCNIKSPRMYNPEVHPELEKIVLKSLTKDRELRYSSAEAFSKDLNKFLNTYYPDFSKQEFSRFMKDLYSDMYVENRKKLAEYAKIDFDSDGQTEVATTVTATDSQTKTSEDSLGLDQSPNQRVDISKLMNAGAGKTGLSVVRKNPLMTNIHHGVNRSGTQTGFTPGGNTSFRKPLPTQSSGSSNWLVGLLVLIGVLSGVYYYSQTQKRLARNRQIESSVHQQIQGEEELASKNLGPKTVPLNIQSTPSGAKVILNDVPIGETPVISHVEAGKPFKLVLFRDGYLPSEYISEMPSSDGYSRSVVMMPEPTTGTIVINTNSRVGPSTIVTINGQRVSDTVPYVAKVAAGTPITITLTNPLARTQGTETIIIRQNEKRSVTIPINRQATINE